MPAGQGFGDILAEGPFAGGILGKGVGGVPAEDQKPPDRDDRRTADQGLRIGHGDRQPGRLPYEKPKFLFFDRIYGINRIFFACG